MCKWNISTARGVLPVFRSTQRSKKKDRSFRLRTKETTGIARVEKEGTSSESVLSESARFSSFAYIHTLVQVLHE